MQLPLLHRSTQMAVLKKLVRRKARELRRRRHRAQRRLVMMRQIRWELLRLMQRLIDQRQRDSEQQRREQARRLVGGILHMYKRWLGKWTRALGSQGRLIRQEEQLKRRLNRRLRLLRKRLRKHHRPKQLVDRCFEKLARAVKRWQRRPDYRQDQELIWAQEVEEVRRYLSDIRGRTPRRRKSPRRTGDNLHIDLPNFSSFWKSEVVPKKRRLGMVQAPSQEIPSEREVYRIPKPPLSSKTYPNLDVIKADQIRSRGRISARIVAKKNRMVPSLKEVQQVFRLLMDHNQAEKGNATASSRNSKRKLSRKAAKTDLYKDLKREIDIRKPQFQRKRDGSNQVSLLLNRLLRIDSAVRSKILQSRVGLIKRAKKHKWLAMTTFRKRIPIRHKYVKKPKSKFVDEKIRREIEAFEKKGRRRKKSTESRNLWDISDLSISSFYKSARKPKSKFGGEKIRREMGKNVKKSPRSSDSKTSKNLWDSSDLSISTTNKSARKPKSKFDGEKISREMEKNTKSPRSKSSKNLWDTSDLSTSFTNKSARKPKSKFGGEKIRREMEKNTKKSPRRRDSNTSKNLWDSSDLSFSSSFKNIRKPKSKVMNEEIIKEVNEKEPWNEDNRMGKRRWDSSESEELRDSSDLLAPGTRNSRLKRIRLKRKRWVSNQPSDDGTDIMVNKLMKRKQLYEKSVSDQVLDPDTVASFSESVNEIIMESRPTRKAIRKSILGLGLHPAASKSKHPTSKQPLEFPNPSLKRNSNRNSLLGSYRPRRSSRISARAVASAPAVSGRRSLNADTSRKRSTRWSRGTDESVVQSNNPKVVYSNELAVIRSNELIMSNEGSKEGSAKLGIDADHQLGDQKVNESGNAMRVPNGYEKKYEYKQDINNAGPLRFIKGDQFSERNLSQIVPEEVKLKAEETIDQDKIKTGTKISFSVGVKEDDQTIDQDVNKASTSPVSTDGQSNAQDTNKTSQDQRQEASRALDQNEQNINQDLLPQLGHSRSEGRSETKVFVGFDHKKDSLVPGKYSIKNLQSDDKYRQIQFFLKDVIETNYILDDVPDVQGLMNAVGNHYMWGNLKDLHSELLAGGISKPDVKRLLTDKYLAYLKTIRSAQIMAPKNAGTSREGREQDTKKQSKSDQLRNLRFWYRNRMTRWPFLFGTQSQPEDNVEARSYGTANDMDGTMQKLIAQELKAERAKREKWDERLRRLLPASDNSATMSFTSSNTMWEVEPEEEEDLRTVEERYSVTNLMKMMKEHKVRFQAVERERMMAKARRGKVDSKVKLVEKQSESLFEPPPPKKLSRQSTKKREKHLLRPINQLYYAPRKTCREQQVIKYYSEYSEDEQDKALEEENEYQDSCTEKCPKCGVKVDPPCCGPSPTASSAILSSGSIEACAKNELLVNTMADVCTRCGFVHDEANPCTQPPEDQRKTMLLRLIKAVQAVRSTTQPTQCSEFCSCREILKRQEKDLRSCKSKLRQVESRVRRSAGTDEGGGDR